MQAESLILSSRVLGRDERLSVAQIRCKVEGTLQLLECVTVLGFLHFESLSCLNLTTTSSISSDQHVSFNFFKKMILFRNLWVFTGVPCVETLESRQKTTRRA